MNRTTAQADAFFLPDGDAFVATEWTRGPWSPDHQHGGPPSALVARAIERELGNEGFTVSRVTVELLSPIPITPLEIRTSSLRAGRRVQRIDATLSAAGRPLARMTALAIRTTDLALSTKGAPPDDGRPPGPEASAPFAFTFFRDAVGYHTAMEGRLARGTWGRGAVAMWLRMRVPLVPGEPPSPLQRVMTAADSGSGVAVVLDPSRYTFVNADLTTALHRVPEGEWICLDAETRVDASGVGLTETRLWDVRGRIGRALQTLVIEPRTS